ncbi:MAG: hypothetical protein ABSG11_05605 [Candidatus Korobacteraceae bacterium]
MNFSRHWLHRIPRFYWLAAILLLAVAIWSAASGLLFAKKGGDGQIDYLPSRVFSARVFRSGALPLWNPNIFSGMSHLAIVQTAPFYPPNILLYIVLPSTVAFNVTMMLHVLLLLGFSHAYFRLLTDREEAAWLGAVAFSFSGFLLLHIEAIGIFNSAAWIPALFYCVEKWIRTRDWKFSAAGGICLAFQLLAGWPQMVLLSAIYVAIYVLSAMPQERRRFQLLGGVLTMGLLAAGIGAIEVLPTMEFKPFSNLAVLPYSHFLSNSVAPQTLVTLLFPYVMGADYTTCHPVAFFGPAQMVVTASYMGVLPLMFGVAALSFWRRSRYVRFASCSAVVAVFLACVAFTPLAPLLYRLPVYNFFRDHRVNVIFLAFSVASLTAYASGNVEQLSSRLRIRLARAVPLGFVATAAVLLIEMRAILGSMNPRIAPLDGMWVWRLHQFMHFGNRDMVLAWLTLLVAAILFWRWMMNPASKLISRLAVAFVLADLLWFGLSDQPHFSPGDADSAQRATCETVNRATGGDPFRTMSLAPNDEFVRPNLNEIAGVDDIYGYSALIPRQYADLLPASAFELPHWPELMANNAILSLLNTRFILAGGDEAKALENRFIGNRPLLQMEEAATAEAQNVLSPDGWIALTSGQQLETANPFQCAAPPCGMQQAGLMLRKNSVYELRFTVSAATQITNLNIVVARHHDWRPLQSFSISNVQLTPRPTPYVDIYVTAQEDEFVDLRFSTDYPAAVHVSDVCFARAGSLPASNPYREIANHNGIVVIENQNALPRAFFVSQVTGVADYQQARNRLWDPVNRFQPLKEALVEGVATENGLGAGRVEKLNYLPNQVNFEVSCPSYCYLVLGDLYLPGWQATVDGAPAEIRRTDAVVRGMFVSGGSHRVEFRYRPRSILIGLWSVLLSCVVLVLMTGYSVNHSRNNR